jgi:hypothetical protein
VSPTGLPLAGAEVLASVAQHRVLSTGELRRIHFPDRSARRTQQVLADLRALGLLADVRRPGAADLLWFVTEAGSRAAERSGALSERPRLLERAEAVGQLQAHTMAVNDAAIAFLEAARERGDEFGPFSWRHEVAHPLNVGRGRRRRSLIADAILTYLQLDGDEVAVQQRFLEVDRATLSVDRLAAELGRYAELYRAADEGGRPLWRRLYPSFPPVLCVLGGGERRALERRRMTVAALLRSDPQMSHTPEVSILFCLEGELCEQGPFAPIFTDLRDSGAPVSWVSP